MSPRWIFDDSRSPLIVLRLPSGTQEPPDLPALFRDVEALFETKGRYVVVQDLTYANPDAGRRRMTVDWLKRNADPIRDHIVALGLVAPTAVQRGLIVALKWFVTPLIPFEGFPDFRSALEWSKEKARNAGLVVR